MAPCKFGPECKCTLLQLHPPSSVNAYKTLFDLKDSGCNLKKGFVLRFFVFYVHVANFLTVIPMSISPFPAPIAFRNEKYTSKKSFLS